MLAFKPSKPLRGLQKPLTLIAGISCVLLLQGCAENPRALQIHLPSLLRETCVGPTSAFRTQAEDDAFKVRQEEALRACDARRAAVVEIVDSANEATRAKPWWKVF